ncbi:hypothetical protein VNO77_00495 [Canavalia gladiata]|uniref:Uncharacterized protein n=1 Tax=Canavalia gladiata TaxID=3824 RepID=A0AAN9R435_CANGL
MYPSKSPICLWMTCYCVVFISNTYCAFECLRRADGNYVFQLVQLPSPGSNMGIGPVLFRGKKNLVTVDMTFEF